MENHQTRKTHCPKGHPYSGDNLYVAARRGGGSNRFCRACQAERQRLRTKEAGLARIGRPVKLLSERLWPQIDKARPAAECWPWLGRLDRRGYGAFHWNGRAGGAHRAVWEATHGPIASSKIFVLHRCDNPACCNPAHLFLGSAADNMADKVAKGRQAKGDKARPKKPSRGEAHGRAKLTAEDVRWLREEKARTGRSFDDLAKEKGVSRSAVRTAVRGVTWVDV